MNYLSLFPGPRLIRKAWTIPDEAPVREDVDVTDKAHTYLFRTVRLEEGVTLQDLFGLFEADQILPFLYQQDFAEEVLEEARKGPVASAGELDYERLEALELYGCWKLDTSTGELDGAERWSLHGVGITPQEDIYQDEYLAYPKGERITWSLTLTPLRELLALPIKHCSQVPLLQNDFAAKRFGQALHQVDPGLINLGELLHSVLYALTFFGGPQSQAVEREGLKAQMAELANYRNAEEDEAEGEGVEIGKEDFFVSLGFRSRESVNAQFFEGSMTGDLSAVTRLVREVEDHEPARPALLELSSGELELRAEYASLTGYQLRKAIREAGHAPQS